MRRGTRPIKEVPILEESDWHANEDQSPRRTISLSSSIGSRFDLRSPVEGSDVAFQTVATVIKSWEIDLKRVVPTWKEVGGELLLRR